MVKRMEVEGQVYSSNNYGDVIILEYINSYNVKIRFINTGYVTTTQMSNIRSGRVRDPYVPTVFGIGVLGDKYATCVNSKTVKEYLLWHSMLERCYSTLQHVKTHLMLVALYLIISSPMNTFTSGVIYNMGLV